MMSERAGAAGRSRLFAGAGGAAGQFELHCFALYLLVYVQLTALSSACRNAAGKQYFG
jgi:hypothetical protein